MAMSAPAISEDEVRPLATMTRRNDQVIDDNDVVKENHPLCACVQCLRHRPPALLRDLTEPLPELNCKNRLSQLFTVATLKEHFPISKWLLHYTLHQLQGDLIAGTAVGLTVIPQSLAYAKIAELPPQYGLYSAFMGCFVYVLLGTSKDVNIGPTAVMSLLTATFAHGSVALAVILSLCCGVIQILLALLRVGFVVDYISHPVINSFTTAAAITIAASQLKRWLGLEDIPRGFIPAIYTILRKLPETRVYDFCLGTTCMILLFLLKKLKELRIKHCERESSSASVMRKAFWIIGTARNAIVVVNAAVFCGVLYHNSIVPFSLTSNITSGLPPWSSSQFELLHSNQTVMSVYYIFHQLGIGIVVLPIIGLIELVAIGKAFGRRHGYNIDANQEFLAVGVGNLLSCFVSAYPVTASFSRSAVNAQSGAVTTLAGLFTGILVLLSLAFLTPLFYYIPDTVLAAVIIMAVTDMISFTMITHLWAINKLDLLPWLVTFFVSLGAGFEYGIVLGVVTSLLILLYPWARPRIKIADYDTGDRCTIRQDLLPSNILVVDVSMGILFPGIETLRDNITAKAFQHDRCYSVIVDFTKVEDLDYTSVIGIDELMKDFAAHKTWIVFTNVNPSVVAILNRAKVNIRHTDSLTSAVHLIMSNSAPDDAMSGLKPTDTCDSAAAADDDDGYDGDGSLMHKSLPCVTSEADISIQLSDVSSRTMSHSDGHLHNC